MNFGFCASTGRTATTFLAKTLDSLPSVVAMHEGYDGQTHEQPLLPLINVHNKKAWQAPSYALDIVQKMRSPELMSQAGVDANLCVDVAFYNAPLMDALFQEYPCGKFLVMFRRCEDFVRSATIRRVEDMTPAGWSDPDKKLTPREQFIAMGRLKPDLNSAEGQLWQSWSGVKRNIWLWATINRHLLDFASKCSDCTVLFYEDLKDNPKHFWRSCLSGLNVLTEENLEACLLRAQKKVNSRTAYDVGTIETWDADEQAMYLNMSKVLEEEIYDRRA